jgi:hypothetical protein
MNKHGKLVNALIKLRFVEESQRSIKEIGKQIEYYKERNLDLVSKWAEGMPEYVQAEIENTDIKIKALKWTVYDD